MVKCTKVKHQIVVRPVGVYDFGDVCRVLFQRYCPPGPKSSWRPTGNPRHV
jgi:hypothetical protein